MRVAAPDLELWFTTFLRAEAQAAGLDVGLDNKEPADLKLPLAKPLIVVRDDSGPRIDYVTFERAVGFSVLAGTRMWTQPANDLARWLASVVHDEELALVAGSPIASVDWGGCNGPYPVPDELDVARRYLTGRYVVAGSW